MRPHPDAQLSDRGRIDLPEIPRLRALERLRRLGESLCARPWWVAGALTLIGAWLRLADIGAFDFRWDEDLYSLAAKAILERGIPELPSGMVYLRGGAFLYLVAGSIGLFGFDETTMRLPAALFGIATIPLGFLFASRLFGNGVGLLVAGLLMLSVWDIEFSRYARMYAPFEFFYLLTLLAIWRYRVVTESLAGGLLCIALACVTISLHDLGYSLALAFVVPLLIRDGLSLREPRRLVFPAIAFGTTAAFFFIWSRIQDYAFNRAAIRAAQLDPSAAAATASADQETLVEMIAGYIYLPDIPLLRLASESIPLVTAALIGGTLLATGLFLWRRRACLDVVSVLLLAVIAVTCALQLFNMALLATLALAFVKRQGIGAFRLPQLRFAIVLIGVLFIGWLALGLAIRETPDAGFVEHLETRVRQLLDYPRFFVFWGFAQQYPLLSIPALIGGLWAFDRAARVPGSRAALFLLCVFAIPMILNGVFSTQHQIFRYNVPFGPLFYTFVALGLTQWRAVLAAWNQDAQPSARTPRSAWVTIALVALVLAVDMNPLRSWFEVQRSNLNEAAFFGLIQTQGRYPEYRSPAVRYITDHARPDDKIIAFECREYFNYLQRLDYCVVSSWYYRGKQLKQTYFDGTVYRDLYLSTPMIMSGEELERLLRGAPGTKWLVASDRVVKNERAVGKSIFELIEDSAGNVVYASPDGMAKVYRF